MASSSVTAESIEIDAVARSNASILFFTIILLDVENIPIKRLFVTDAISSLCRVYVNLKHIMYIINYLLSKGQQIDLSMLNKGKSDYEKNRNKR